jgi:hypothetical protein
MAFSRRFGRCEGLLVVRCLKSLKVKKRKTWGFKVLGDANRYAIVNSAEPATGCIVPSARPLTTAL